MALRAEIYMSERVGQRRMFEGANRMAVTGKLLGSRFVSPFSKKIDSISDVVKVGMDI